MANQNNMALKVAAAVFAVAFVVVATVMVSQSQPQEFRQAFTQVADEEPAATSDPVPEPAPEPVVEPDPAFEPDPLLESLVLSEPTAEEMALASLTVITIHDDKSCSAAAFPGTATWDSLKKHCKFDSTSTYKDRAYVIATGVSLDANFSTLSGEYPGKALVSLGKDSAVTHINVVGVGSTRGYHLKGSGSSAINTSVSSAMYGYYVDGENTIIIDSIADNNGYGFYSRATNALFEEIEAMNNNIGFYMMYSTNNYILNSSFHNNDYGIRIYYNSKEYLLKNVMACGNKSYDIHGYNYGGSNHSAQPFVTNYADRTYIYPYTLSLGIIEACPTGPSFPVEVSCKAPGGAECDSTTKLKFCLWSDVITDERSKPMLPETFASCTDQVRNWVSTGNGSGTGELDIGEHYVAIMESLGSYYAQDVVSEGNSKYVQFVAAK